jgi:hypothetical protein
MDRGGSLVHSTVYCIGLLISYTVDLIVLMEPPRTEAWWSQSEPVILLGPTDCQKDLACVIVGTESANL